MNGYVLQFLQVYIEPKAQTLSSTAETQSKSELATTQETDLDKQNNAQSGLATKDGELAAKAQALYNQAQALETAATTDTALKPLNGPAQKLKTAAKGSGGLYEKAETLAEVGSGNAANTQADQVINAFENVETEYTKLMRSYKLILDKPEQAAKLTQTDKDKVTEVVKKYLFVKNTYYQMLIVYRIKQKAEEFHKEAQTLKNEAQKAALTDTPLGKLQGAAKSEMDDLVTKANLLKGIELGTEDSYIVTKYLDVVDKYKTLESKKAFKAALKAEVPDVQKVKTTFEALNESYENVLKIRVQELSKKSEPLKNAANELKSDDQLSSQANALRNAASKGSEGLKEKADLLVGAINGSTQVGTQAEAVITQFDRVTAKYNLLTTDHNYNTHKDKTEVKAVVSAYTALNKHYDTMLNVKKAKLLKDQVGTVTDEKILQRANDLYTNANTLAISDKLSSQAELKNLAENLKNAVGQNTNAPGSLQKALNDLKNAKENEIVTKAKEVITKYNKVKEAYGKVTEKETQYKEALKGTSVDDETSKYTNVTSAFQALQFCPP